MSEAALLAAIFCLPFSAVWLISQTSADIGGAFNAFAVPKLYLSEPLVAFASMLYLVAHPPSLSPRLYALAGVAIIAACSPLWSQDPLLAVTGALHVTVGLLFLLALVTALQGRSFARKAAVVFVATVSLQAAWAVAQYALQHDLGLAGLGESALRPDIPGVAKIVTDGENHIRGYGSLPHPNVLAAYVSAAIFIVGSWLIWPSTTRRQRAALTLTLLMLSAGLLVTFSRVALILTLINGSLVLAFTYRRWRRLPWEAFVAAAAFVVFAAYLTQPLMSRTSVNSAQETGITNRAVGYEAAFAMITERPYGVGAGNFVREIESFKPGLPAYQQQPAHNAPLLITAELGIMGGVLVIAYICLLGWRFHTYLPSDHGQNTVNFSLFMLGGVFIGMGMVDHFFWSLPMGLLLIAAYAAAIESRLQRSKPAI